MKRLQESNHTHGVVVREVQTRSLFEALVPQFVPENRHTDQLVADEEGLLDDNEAMLPHAVHDVQRCFLPHRARRLRSDRKRIDERLGMVLSDFGKQIVDVPPNVVARCLYACNDLQGYE